MHHGSIYKRSTCAGVLYAWFRANPRTWITTRQIARMLNTTCPATRLAEVRAQLPFLRRRFVLDKAWSVALGSPLTTRSDPPRGFWCYRIRRLKGNTHPTTVGEK